jgi:hypothetical protein
VHSLTSGEFAANHSAAGTFTADGDKHDYSSHLALTVETVAKLDTLAGTPFLAWCGGDVTSADAAENACWALGVKVTTGELLYTHEHTAGTAVTVEGPVLPTGEWFHLAFTRNAAATSVKLYINGTLVKTSGALTAPDGGAIVQGTSAVGSGGNGVVTTTVGATIAEGATSNDLQVTVDAALEERGGYNVDRPLSASFDGTTVTVRLAVTDGALVAAANTATLVAAAITALTGFTAAASGTGATALTATETVAVTSGTSPVMIIGSAAAASDTYDWEGDIRDIRVTRAERTAAQITAASLAALGR